MSRIPLTTSSSQRELLIVYCGGTFGMRPSPHGLVATDHLDDTLTPLISNQYPGHTRVTHRYVSLEPAIDSANVAAQDALRIAGTIRHVIDQADGVVVIHGTDTLAFSSAVAAFALADMTVPIVFTGSQRSIFEENNDAANNFSDALHAAVHGRAGVQIVFGGKVIPGISALKTSTDAFTGFSSFRTPHPERSHVEVHQYRFCELNKFRDTDQAPQVPRIGRLKIFPGFDQILLQRVVEVYPDGIILETYGAGTAPTADPLMQQELVNITDAGTPIVAVTQCLTGSVTLSRYAAGAALKQSGVWSGSNLTSDAAHAKLLVFSALQLSQEELQWCFTTNFVGEQTPHPHIDDIVEACLA